MADLGEVIKDLDRTLVLGAASVSLLMGIAFGKIAYDIYSGANSRPSEYRQVSIIETKNAKGNVKTSGKATGKLTTEYGEVKLNITLRKGNNSIECKSNELRGDFSFPIMGNYSNSNKITTAYNALIRNERNNEKVTVKGKANKGRIEMYEIEIGNKNYVLLNR